MTDPRTIRERIEALGYSLGGRWPVYRRSIENADGRVVAVLSAHEAVEWLREREAAL